MSGELKPMNFECHFKTKCPCGKEIEVGEMRNGDTSMPCVLRVEPMCKKFEELDVIEFLHYVNVMAGNWN
jgi:hypothetical protein